MARRPLATGTNLSETKHNTIGHLSSTEPNRVLSQRNGSRTDSHLGNDQINTCHMALRLVKSSVSWTIDSKEFHILSILENAPPPVTFAILSFSFSTSRLPLPSIMSAIMFLYDVFFFFFFLSGISVLDEATDTGVSITGSQIMGVGAAGSVVVCAMAAGAGEVVVVGVAPCFCCWEFQHLEQQSPVALLPPRWKTKKIRTYEETASHFAKLGFGCIRGGLVLVVHCCCD